MFREIFMLFYNVRESLCLKISSQGFPCGPVVKNPPSELYFSDNE